VGDLSAAVGIVPAVVVVALVAYVPGWLVEGDRIVVTDRAHRQYLLTFRPYQRPRAQPCPPITARG
jgi:hypothetical protein